jgi:3-oxo-5-alpha-steroid 4-dehydrogenase 1
MLHLVGSFLLRTVSSSLTVSTGRLHVSKFGITYELAGMKSWTIMELVSPALFIYGFVVSPLSYYTPRFPSWNSPQTLLASLYLIHYTNRALISPLRTPSRSKLHIIVAISAVAFNCVNGYIMGSYLSSPVARIYLNSASTFQNPIFYVGLCLWGVGFAGNILHDEILYDIRRKAMSKGKGKATEDSQTSQNKHYAIPQGWLYHYISFPNYFCEWVEWFGFALASAPFPLDQSSFSLASLTSIFSISGILSTFSAPSHLFCPQLTPPYIFFITEVLLMLPRAYRGHQWYIQKFGENYPKERKAVIPFLL